MPSSTCALHNTNACHHSTINVNTFLLPTGNVIRQSKDLSTDDMFVCMNLVLELTCTCMPTLNISRRFFFMHPLLQINFLLHPHLSLVVLCYSVLHALKAYFILLSNTLSLDTYDIDGENILHSFSPKHPSSITKTSHHPNSWYKTKDVIFYVNI